MSSFGDTVSAAEGPAARWAPVDVATANRVGCAECGRPL
jgi:hypothetical protein